jgi:hypothetical protein
MPSFSKPIADCFCGDASELRWFREDLDAAMTLGETCVLV